ncbi:MAG: aerobic-type carbon monoxide dehydrogenase, large subunit CoxL/CutL-like protein [Phenylobacterium sp.]|uniref:xanthine dehydrogenase family protein molybdopterin-binding subunit n=1 Tax=Phenylobacterium sp. TaxID=1871053 RepID=UPI0026217B41|nr:xanthine dehydrogenase family protein molybdopterin-binding subunit [Phenylobacterium sp.]MDB5498022.1 aerobic-type carbon monoxide dehydrogenase, large subunit CoxL/CutL-like protein [Phenylobacterium sp.]
MSSVSDWEAASNPVKENRAGNIGKAVDRYEGPLKVTGTAPYAYEVEPPSPPAYGVMVSAPIARGRITAVDTAAAETSPGVQLVWTYRNAPAQGPRPERYDFFTPSPRPALESDQVHFFGQQVAIVVADTLENAQAGAALVNLTFEDDAKSVIFHDHYDEGVQPPGEQDVEIGDFASGFDAAPVKIDDVWRTPLQNHCQMEPCATTAWWDGDHLTVHTSVQMVRFAQNSLAETLMMPHKSVRLLTRYVGGGFGGKGSFYEDLVLASLAARELGRPVKVAFSRQQMMHGTVHRPATEVRVRLGATPDGKLTAMSLMTTTHCDRRGNFTEHASNFARSLYAAPNRLTGHRLVRLDLPVASAMRAPGEASGTLSLEVAMDELAEKLGMDPVELRVINEPEVDPETGKPFSIRQLVRCMREGAQMFGWDNRKPIPGQVRDGRWLVGMGMAAAIRGNFLLPAKASFTVDAEGVITVKQGMTDIGTGTYTVLAQIAAETLGVPLRDVRVEIGDSELPPAPGSGGQFGAATAGSAALDAGMNLRKAIAEIAVNDPASPLNGGDPADVTFQDGVIAIANRSERLSELIRRNRPEGLTANGEIHPAADSSKWSQHTYGAHYVEVGVDTVTGEVRTRRMLGVFAAGRILNWKTARSQLTGGMIWGVGSALTEGNAVDARYGSLINQDLAGYLVPVQADIGEVEAIMLDEVDDKANPMGIKGVGELGISGAGAAVANAIYNACGVRVRDYPITPDKILAALV